MFSRSKFLYIFFEPQFEHYNGKSISNIILRDLILHPKKTHLNYKTKKFAK